MLFYDLNSKVGRIISKLLHNISFELASGAKTGLCLLIVIAALKFRLSHLFTVRFQLNLSCFIFLGRIDFEINTEHPLQLLPIQVFLSALAQVRLWRVEHHIQAAALLALFPTKLR